MTSRIDSKSVAFVLCFAGVIVLAGVAALGQEEPKRSNEGVARTGKGENHPAIAKPVSIAMDSIYTTNDQDSVKHVRRRDKDDLDAIYRETNGVGASNLFLVRGKDIAGAVFYTRSVFTRSVSVDVLSRPADCKQVWLVAYFGVAGSGSAWIVKSVEKREKAAIRLVYERGESDLNDIHQYFAWAPLGDLAPGSYSLEMFDAKEKQVTLMRRVTVKINADE